MEKIECFSDGTVVCDLKSTEKYAAIGELLARAPVFRSLENLCGLEQAVVERERIQSTGLGNGVAVAHGKSQAVRNILMALGVSRPGIPFDSMDGLPVHLLFLIANPPGTQLDYLLALSILVQVVHDEAFREELLCCADSCAMEHKLHQALIASMMPKGVPLS